MYSDVRSHVCMHTCQDGSLREHADHNKPALHTLRVQEAVGGTIEEARREGLKQRPMEHSMEHSTEHSAEPSVAPLCTLQFNMQGGGGELYCTRGGKAAVPSALAEVAAPKSSIPQVVMTMTPSSLRGDDD